MQQIKNIQRKESHVHSHDHTHSHGHHHPKPSKSKVFFLRLVYSNAYLALPIVAITAETYLYLGEFVFDGIYLGFIFFATLFLYPFHRLFGVFTTMEIEYTKAQKEVAQHSTLTKYAVFTGLIGTIGFASQLHLNTLSLLIPLGLISLIYSVHVIPTSQGWKRLRDIPGIKIYAITLVVTLTTSTIPLLISGFIDSTNIWFLSIQRFLFILAITIPFDVRDAHLDKRWNLKTIPLLIGNENAIKVSIALLYGSAVVSFVQYYFTGYFGIEIVIASFLAAGFTHFILYDFKNKNAYLYNAMLIEGSMIYHFALISIAYILTDLF